jgi:hypothetical protein
MGKELEKPRDIDWQAIAEKLSEAATKFAEGMERLANIIEAGKGKK